MTHTTNETTGARPRSGQTLPVGWTVLALTTAAAVALGLLAAIDPRAVVVVLVGSGLVACVWAFPVTAALLVIGVTPLVVGIERGKLVPVLRPNEALVLALACILAVRALVRAPRDFTVRLSLHRLEWSLVLMATAASVLPLLWMLVRGQHPTGDDLSYALVLWKYFAVYILVRVAVRTERQVLVCLVVSVASAVLVGVIAVLQALDLLGVRHLLLGWYVPLENVNALAKPRAGSTLALPAAAADLLILNLAVVVGLASRLRRHRAVWIAAGAICVLGVLASGEFSSLLGLLVCAVAMSAALNRLPALRYAPLALVGAVLVMWPVVATRLTSFQTVHGFPVSWVTRLTNLQHYFWPPLFSGSGFLLGVRPSARIPVATQATGFVWIESGYTWLFWGGGVPLFLAFVYFVSTALSVTWRRCRPLDTWSGVAALGAFVGGCVVAVLMIFDPHLTYRGSADAWFALLGLTLATRATGARVEGRAVPRKVGE